MSSTDDDLAEFRQEIDKIDAALIGLLAQRFAVTAKVGEYKAAHHLPPVDPSRETIQSARVEELAKQAGLSHDFAHKMLRLIIDEVVANHKSIQNA